MKRLSLSLLFLLLLFFNQQKQQQQQKHLWKILSSALTGAEDIFKFFKIKKKKKWEDIFLPTLTVL